MNPIWEEACAKHEQQFKPWVKILGYIISIPVAVLFWILVISDYWGA